MPPFRVLFIATVFCLFTSTASAQVEVLYETYRNPGKTSVKVEAVFAPSAQQGSLPFQVTISNQSGKDRTWEVTISDGNSYRTLSTDITGTISVENGAVVTRELYLPIAPLFTTYSYHNTKVEVSSPGLGTVSRSVGHETNDDFPTVAISKVLARRSLSDLDDHVQNRSPSDTRFALPYLPEQLPVNWRGYSALDAIMIDHKSWEALEDSQRRGMLEWVRLGGRLDIFTTEQPPNGKKLAVRELEIEGVQPFRQTPGSGRFSLGQIHLKNWDGDSLEVSIVSDYSKIQKTPRRSEELRNNFGRDWNLRREFGDKKFSPAIILIPLLIFAIVVAPVNLFQFAKKGQRHRLFFTTPIISLAACLIIVAIIFLEDGVGGKGHRTILADIQSQSGEMRLYVTQEQVSRTGVILSSGFESDTEMVMDPVNLPPSIFNPFSGGSNRTTNYHFSEQHCDGEFFRSRSEQGFSIRTSQPTRARVEVESTARRDSPPSLVSSLPVAISAFYYRSDDGKTWRAPENTVVAPGSPIPLESADPDEYKEWLKTNSVTFSQALANRIRNLGQDQSRYFALPESAESFAVTSHPSIRWAREPVLLTGIAVNPNPAAGNE